MISQLFLFIALATNNKSREKAPFSFRTCSDADHRGLTHRAQQRRVRPDVAERCAAVRAACLAPAVAVDLWRLVLAGLRTGLRDNTVVVMPDAWF